MSMSAEVAQTDGELAEEQTDTLPHPRDDPTFAYVHEGKRYTVSGGGPTFEVVDYDPETCSGLDGLVTIETVEEGRINSEHRHQKGGVSREVLEPHIPERSDRAVWTATGLLSSLRRLEILEGEPGSYRDYYWNRQD